MVSQVVLVQPQQDNVKLLITQGQMERGIISITDGIGPVLLIPAIRATRPTSALTAASTATAATCPARTVVFARASLSRMLSGSKQNQTINTLPSKSKIKKGQRG